MVSTANTITKDATCIKKKSYEKNGIMKTMNSNKEMWRYDKWDEKKTTINTVI